MKLTPTPRNHYDGLVLVEEVTELGRRQLAFHESGATKPPQNCGSCCHALAEHVAFVVIGEIKDGRVVNAAENRDDPIDCWLPGPWA